MITRTTELTEAQDAFTKLINSLDSRTFNSQRNELLTIADYFSDQQTREANYK